MTTTPNTPTAPAHLADEDAWDETRTEIAPADIYLLKRGDVIEARTREGVRVRIRLAGTPTESPLPGNALATAYDGAVHELDDTSLTVIGVPGDETPSVPEPDVYPMRARVPRGRVVHEAKQASAPGIMTGCATHYTAEQVRDFPLFLNDAFENGTEPVEVTCRACIKAAARREVPEQQKMRKTLIEAGHAPHAESPDAQHGHGGFKTNETSTSAIRVRYVPGLDSTHLDAEKRDELRADMNDDYAEALARAGFYVTRRGAGAAVYAHAAKVQIAAPDVCQYGEHEGEQAPAIAVLPTDRFDSVYACRACVRRRREHDRCLSDLTAAQPYVVRRWDAQGRTLLGSSDPRALDFADFETEREAREAAEAMPGKAWLHTWGKRPELVTVAEVSIDRATFSIDGSLRAFGRIAERPGHDVVKQAEVDEWNAKHPIGTPVRYWAGVREGEGIESRTRSRAEFLGGHTSVVWVEGEGSCISLTHVEPEVAPHEHTWVTALDGNNEPHLDEQGRTWQHCGVCGEKQSDVAELLRRAAIVLRRWIGEQGSDAFAPSAITMFGPEMLAQFERTPVGQAPRALLESARLIVKSSGVPGEFGEDAPGSDCPNACYCCIPDPAYRPE